MRDRLAHWIANRVLRCVGTRAYVDQLNATYVAGMALWRHPDIADQLIARMRSKAATETKETDRDRP